MMIKTGWWQRWWITNEWALQLWRRLWWWIWWPAGECFCKNYDKNDDIDKYTKTLKANGFGKEGLRRVATLHLPTPLVILIIFRLMQKTCPYALSQWIASFSIIQLVAPGARLRRRKSSPRQEPALVERDPKIRLSKQFREVLQDIYDRVDLDNSGSLSRAEFNLFNWRTSGEEVADEEWQVGEQNFRGNL